MPRDLSDLRTLAQAVADLIKKRDGQPYSSQERVYLERMIHDIQAEIAIRNRDIN